MASAPSFSADLTTSAVNEDPPNSLDDSPEAAKRLPEKVQKDSTVAVATDTKSGFEPGAWVQVAASFVAWMNTVCVYPQCLVIPQGQLTKVQEVLLPL
jgi:hypothetical protein